MDKKALVTGGGGFLGLYIVEALLTQGWQVRVLCRGHYASLEALDVEIIHADITDQHQVLEACHDINTVFHAASKTGPWGDYQEFYNTNVIGTQNIISACKQQNVSRLIYTSSPSVLSFYDDLINVDESHPFPKKRISAYQETKMIAEKAVLAANSASLSTTALRPHALWGPRDTHLFAAIIERVKAGKLKIIGEGNNKISVSYVENSALAHLQAANSDNCAGKVYFINETEPVELWPWINELVTEIGLQPVTKKVPYKLAYTLGFIIENIYTALPFLGEPPMTRALVSVCGKDHYFDTSRAEKDFQFTNVIPMQEAKARFVRYFKQGPS
ncbi:MAG: NAD-dependent epimerase/dehydratase family protein [Pseudomonadales bacterium]|nr:NAD-dependent epimerase/dehydratase family protein [Pseudomonadales bacterium]